MISLVDRSRKQIRNSVWRKTSEFKAPARRDSRAVQRTRTLIAHSANTRIKACIVRLKYEYNAHGESTIVHNTRCASAGRDLEHSCSALLSSPPHKYVDVHVGARVVLYTVHCTVNTLSAHNSRSADSARWPVALRCSHRVAGLGLRSESDTCSKYRVEYTNCNYVCAEQCVDTGGEVTNCRTTTTSLRATAQYNSAILASRAFLLGGRDLLRRAE